MKIEEFLIMVRLIRIFKVVLLKQRCFVINFTCLLLLTNIKFSKIRPKIGFLYVGSSAHMFLLILYFTSWLIPCLLTNKNLDHISYKREGD